MTRAFHRPVPVADIDRSDPESDPAAQAELAHATAALLVPPVDRPRAGTTRSGPPGAGESGGQGASAAGGEGQDPVVVARFVSLAEDLGIEVIARMWAGTPAVSLPGSLWRLYALREWIRRSPTQAARWYRDGMHDSSVAEVVAGVETPPGPDEVARAADRILAGAFTGDYATALARAAAFVTVTIRGRAVDEAEESADLAGFVGLAEDLVAAARAWRAGTLD
ncbi:hypothetical protein [Brevibacterium litoralis]|uniref:hypothetical protein n=1 Tax=Brevibacterium litoralis TaxID=3138935 RepID=UPI0032EDC798